MRLLYFLCLLLLISCKKEAPVVSLDLAIENLESDEITISGFDYMKKIAVVDSKISDTLHITKPGIYTLSFARNRSNIYLTPGDHLTLTADAKDYPESVKIESPHTSIQEYLAQKVDLQKKYFGRSNFDLEPSEYLTKISEGKEELKTLLSSLNVPSNFAAFEQKNIDFNNAKYLFIYPDYADKQIADLSSEFQNPLEGIDLHNEDDFLASSEYKSLVENSFSLKMYKDTSASYEEVFQKNIAALPEGNIRNQLLYGDMRYIMGPNENLESLYSFFKAHSTDQDHLEKMEVQYNDLQKLKKGELSPNFDYKNFAGGNTSLADLEGKYVYIDVWATWCGPCKAEIPYLKEIEKKYHGKNIEFVSISVDSADDEDKWRNMIEDKELGGSQLFSDNSWESKFVQDYRINGIPRFILIDPEGKIVSADAPRPSDNKLTEKFEDLAI